MDVYIINARTFFWHVSWFHLFNHGGFLIGLAFVVAKTILEGSRERFDVERDEIVLFDV